ncbi:tripartite-type tricarboxylate transporter receptor subunit TctC [Scopulibacillus darangshiensis]|uniref:Tripartite-type tricarboxylate transporter receptor subunit TctC n=1 Tax=Scopulibacillus darangshiensis TaxID=442528 RepID=A0A4R2NPW2_9BACL|nr:tripartite tricarboxylate transporter substrate binding protein [Scopulibacillus darangshiensis]TCP23481.1 tripartite-type tricarboxylate transporter receptor subunit TctC [Scopulibacillus darangshiensis]
MKKSMLLIFGLILTLGLSACSSQSSGEGEKQYPKGNLQIIAPATPGGGWDATARAMQKVFKDNDLITNNINVVNKPGGGGEVGWKYLKNQKPNHLAINSSLVLTNNLLGSSDLTYKDFTPLAILTTEWEAVVVPKDSPIKSAKDLMKKLKVNPKSLKVAVAPSLGNDDHLSFVQAAKTYGVDATKLNFLVYGSGGDTVTALLGKHVDVATMSVSEAKEQYKAGKFRILAVTSNKRIKGLDDVPTWKEQGVDMEFPHWRGVMGPPDMTKEQIAYWDKKLSKMVKSDDWKKIMKNNDWEPYYKNSKETKKFLKEQNKMYKDLIDEAGLAKK